MGGLPGAFPSIKYPGSSLRTSGLHEELNTRERKVLSETHGYCVLERFAAQRGDACPSPGVTVRGTTQLRRAGHVGRARQRRGNHPGERGLVEVRLEPGAV